MFGIGVTELVIILVIALLIFGPKKIPEAAKSLGRGISEFRSASKNIETEVTKSISIPQEKVI